MASDISNPYNRTPDWLKYKAYTYENISINETEDQITINFRSAAIERRGRGFIWIAGLLAASALVVLGGLAASGPYPEGIIAVIAGPIVGFWAFHATSITRNGKFVVDAAGVRFVDLYDGSLKERFIEHRLVDGLYVEERMEEQFMRGTATNSRTRQFFNTCLRYSGVVAKIAAYRSKNPANQLALLIGEACRQQFGRPQARASSDEVKVTARVVANDDL
jgi:hypothetical protein